MLYVVMFDFALAALVIVGLGFFVFCCIAFGKELMHKSMEREFVVPIAANATATPNCMRGTPESELVPFPLR